MLNIGLNIVGFIIFVFLIIVGSFEIGYEQFGYNIVGFILMLVGGLGLLSQFILLNVALMKK